MYSCQIVYLVHSPKNTSPLIGRVIALFLAALASAARADVAPDVASTRPAISRSLAFLAREGEAWMNDKDCNACHHMPELIWSFREAKRRGFPIDEAKFDEFVKWAEERATIKTALEPAAMLRLALPEIPAPALSKLILAAQQPDGLWKPGQQFASMQRRDAHEAAENSSRLLLLALASENGDAAAAKAAREKADAALEKTTSSKSVETLVFRALYARHFGSAEEVEGLRAELLKLQHPDGGWGWMVDESTSDPLATGEALYALSQLPPTADATPSAGISRAQRWLVSQQRDDGSWPIDITRISRLDRSGPAKAKSLKDGTGIYTFLGTAWATIGLLQGMPVSESSVTSDAVK